MSNDYFLYRDEEQMQPFAACWNGEEKTFYFWEKDPRCTVSARTLARRALSDLSVEETLTMPSQSTSFTPPPLPPELQSPVLPALLGEPVKPKKVTPHQKKRKKRDEIKQVISMKWR